MSMKRKRTHRFDYGRFGDSLLERGLIEQDVLNHVLQQVAATNGLLPELLVVENLISDWEVSRVACELFHLPFLPVELYSPSKDAFEGYDPNYLRHYALIPLDRYGDLLTVVMPGIVPSEVLDGLLLTENMRVLPIVGSVTTNRRWLSENMPAAVSDAPPVQEAVVPPLPMGTELEAAPGANDDNWLDLFDAAEEAIQLDLQERDGEG